MKQPGLNIIVIEDDDIDYQAIERALNLHSSRRFQSTRQITCKK